MKVFYGVRKDPELLMAAAADQEEEELGEDGKTKASTAHHTSYIIHTNTLIKYLIYLP